MKKLLLFIAFLGVFGGAWADGVTSGTHEDTDDHVTIEDLTVVPGSTDTYKMRVRLEGSQIYTAFEMDLGLPSGLEPEMKKVKDDELVPNVTIWKGDGIIFPYTIDDESGDRTFSHTVAQSFGKAGKNVLRISCYSSINEELTAKSGRVLTIVLKATPYLKPGRDEIKITKCHLITNEEVLVDGKTMKGKQYDCKDRTEYVNVEPHSTATISVSAKNQWTTCIVPFDIPQLPNGLQAYSLGERDAADKHYVVLKPETAIEAYTPYFLYSENGFSSEFSGDVDESKYKEVVQKGEMWGAIVPQSVDNGFVLQNLGDGAKLYSMNSEFVIPAGKCWFFYRTGDDAKSLDLKIEDPAGIKGVETIVGGNSSEPVYTLSGIRVSNPQPGQVYIKGGRKVLRIK